LHSFVSSTDGSNPSGGLTQVASTLYGMTQNGTVHGGGSIFQLGLNGSSFSVVRALNAANGDGVNPLGSLLKIGPLLA